MDRLLRPSWPPVAALVAGVITFIFVLAVTPSGLMSPIDLLLRTEQDPMALSAAYTAGAASSLAVVVMVVLAPLFALADVVFRRATRTNDRAMPDRGTAGTAIRAPRDGV